MIGKGRGPLEFTLVYLGYVVSGATIIWGYRGISLSIAFGPACSIKMPQATSKEHTTVLSLQVMTSMLRSVGLGGASASGRPVWKCGFCGV